MNWEKLNSAFETSLTGNATSARTCAKSGVKFTLEKLRADVGLCQKMYEAGSFAVRPVKPAVVIPESKGSKTIESKTKPK